MKETAKINDNKTENCEVLKNDNMKKNEEIIKKKILDEEEEDDGDNMFINHKFNKRDSYSVQMDRMKKNKGKVFVAEEKIDEELNESEVDLKKWGNFSPNKKKKRGSYFAQIKKQKTMKKMVRFIVSPKENSKKKDFVILETEEIENFPTTDEVSKKLENSNIEELSNNSKKIEENQNLKEETSPEKYSKINENSIKHSIKKKNQPKKASSMKERTDEKASLNQELINESNKNYKEDITINNEVDSVETRNRVSLVILKKENEKSGSSSEEEAVKDYKKWDSFTPQKKRKKPASLANKKAMIMKKNSMRPLNFKSDGLYQENVL